MRLHIKLSGYRYDTNKVSIQFINGELVLIDVLQYIQKGKKLKLITLNTNKRIQFSDEISKLMDCHIGMIIGIENFSRVKYRQLINEAKRMMKAQCRDFYSASDCIECIMAQVGLDVNKIVGKIMSNEEYNEILRILEKEMIKK